MLRARQKVETAILHRGVLQGKPEADQVRRGVNVEERRVLMGVDLLANFWKFP